MTRALLEDPRLRYPLYLRSGYGGRGDAERHGSSRVRNIGDAGYCTAVIGKTHFRFYQADDGHTRDHASGLHDWTDVAGANHLKLERGLSLWPKIEAGSDARDARLGKDVVFSEVNLYSIARSGRYTITIDSLTRIPLELYDMGDDPNELLNLVHEPGLAGVRDRFLRDDSITYWPA